MKENHRTGNALRQAGWRVLTVWECSMKGSAKLVASFFGC
jgi:G:T-mismatch repair DNA endonuclease (very short patch repair protein)